MASPDVAAPPSAFDLEVETLIIGAGACGMIAALAAHEAGQDVLLLEADPIPTGSTAPFKSYLNGRPKRPHPVSARSEVRYTVCSRYMTPMPTLFIPHVSGPSPKSPGRSILIMSAHRSASVWLHHGAAPMRPTAIIPQVREQLLVFSSSFRSHTRAGSLRSE